jgi:hypothetical protein
VSQPAKGAVRAPWPINGMAMWTLRGRPGHGAGGGPTRPARGRASITLGQGGGASTGAGQWCGDTGALRRRGRPGRSARGAPLPASISAGGGRPARKLPDRRSRTGSRCELRSRSMAGAVARDLHGQSGRDSRSARFDAGGGRRRWPWRKWRAISRATNATVDLLHQSVLIQFLRQ